MHKNVQNCEPLTTDLTLYLYETEIIQEHPEITNRNRQDLLSLIFCYINDVLSLNTHLDKIYSNEIQVKEPTDSKNLLHTSSYSSTLTKRENMFLRFTTNGMTLTFFFKLPIFLWQYSCFQCLLGLCVAVDSIL